MAIENRDLPVGTKLVANYKKARYVCSVEAGEEGKLAFRVDGIDKVFNSPSSAGMAVMGGKAVNGWRFWSVEGDAPAAAPAVADRPARTRKGGKKAQKTIYKTPSQQGVAQGRSKWFCVACLKSFVQDGDEQPQACPNGHRINDDELNGEPAPEAVAAAAADED